MQLANTKSTFSGAATVFLSLILLLSCMPGYGQNKPSLKWARFDLLAADTLWKFQDGIAKPGCFDPAFDDSEWLPVSNRFLDNVGKIDSEWSGIGVFRKKIVVPDSLRNRPLELFMSQSGASEIYIDGKLVKQFGSITYPAKNEIIYQTSIPLTLVDSPSHVIAIYHSNKDVARAWLAGYPIKLSPYNDQGGDDNDTFHHMIISLGIIFSFCLFFWFVFAFYPYRVASLLAALVLTNLSFIFFGYLLREFTDHDLRRFLVGEKIWETGFACSYGWILLFLYSVYYKHMAWRLWMVIASMSISVILIISDVDLWFNLTVVLMLLYVIESWRIIILGLKNKRTGFRILAIGFFTSIVGVATTIFDVFNVFPWYLTSTQTVLAIATDLAFPLTLALQFAWEFGSANRDLRIQLNHVGELSKRTAEQELEKQQILSTQNEKLEQQVTQRTSELNTSITELKATQAQLIQSEKMASLGELTAGIAHEIQNPLNFVNNFSEINNELIRELKKEAASGNIVEVNALADDIESNSGKINHHGRRADAIVKGMLQHSKTSTGKKESTDINALCDEYLRLAYHGLRAKDKSFNATTNSAFDRSLEKMNIIPQDIGRVILNLLTNAFYAVTERKNQLADGFAPTVSITTKKMGDKVEIRIRDNGNGIPHSIIDKIFQPFFTTKPAGQGTGLGLSLSYDIVKAHGGDFKVDTKEGEGSTFTIVIPT